MTRHLALIRFTELGRKNVHLSEKRAEEFRDAVVAAGGNVIAQYWALGEYDGCVIFEACSEATAATLLLQLGMAGYVSTHSLRVFDSKEFLSIVAALK